MVRSILVELKDEDGRLDNVRNTLPCIRVVAVLTPLASTLRPNTSTWARRCIPRAPRDIRSQRPWPILHTHSSTHPTASAAHTHPCAAAHAHARTHAHIAAHSAKLPAHHRWVHATHHGVHPADLGDHTRVELRKGLRVELGVARALSTSAAACRRSVATAVAVVLVTIRSSILTKPAAASAAGLGIGLALGSWLSKFYIDLRGKRSVSEVNKRDS